MHEPKWDGFRFQIIKDGDCVRFHSRSGAEHTDRLPRMVEAFGRLPAQSAILDGELVLIDQRGGAHFYKLMAEMRTSHPDEAQLMFMVFDLLHQDGVDLRGLPLCERKRDLHRLCTKSRVPFLKQVEAFPDGAVLLEHCNHFGFEGVVSKRLSSSYVSGPSRHWTKSKCPAWRRDNANRYKLFEGPKKPPAQTYARTTSGDQNERTRSFSEAERERTLERRKVELARVRESLSRPGLRVGMKDALRAQVRVLVQEIAALEAGKD